MRLGVFVLSYNRASYLRTTLESLCAQTRAPAFIRVLDNASTDDSKATALSFADRGVEWHGSDSHVEVIENMRRASGFADADYVMLFHDDDLLHPRYVEWATGVIHENPGIALLGSSMSFHAEPHPRNWDGEQGIHALLHGSREFAARLYDGFLFHFGSAIYDVRRFSSACMRPDRYGKVWDRPFLLDIAGREGKAALFTEPLVQYRCHTGQDSRTAPPYPNILALHANYLRLLGRNPFDRRSRVFLRRNAEFLRDEYPNLGPDRPATLRRYLFQAWRRGAASALSLGYGRWKGIL